MHQIEAACESAQWELAEVVSDRESGRGLERPGLATRCSRSPRTRPVASWSATCGVSAARSSTSERSLESFRDAGPGSSPSTSASTPRHRPATRWPRRHHPGRTGARAHRPRTRSGLAEVRASGRPDGPPVGQRPARPGGAHHRDAQRQHDAPGHRRPAERRGHPHVAWGSHVAPLQRSGGPGLPAPSRAAGATGPLWKTRFRRTAPIRYATGLSCKSVKPIFARHAAPGSRARDGGRPSAR